MINRVCVCISGLGYALVIAPVFSQFLNLAIAHGLTNDFKTCCLVSGYEEFILNLGFCLGTLIGTILYQYIGYGYSCGVIALFMFIMIVIIIVTSFVNFTKNFHLIKYWPKKLDDIETKHISEIKLSQSINENDKEQ